MVIGNNQISTIAKLEEIAVKIDAHGKAAIENILTVGKLLCEARVEFGEDDKAFGQWREKRVPWVTKDSSYRWMNAYKNGGEALLTHNAGVTVTYLLTAEGVPESARQEALEHDALTVKQSKELVRAHKELAELKEECTRLKTDGTKAPANTANLIPGIKELLESGVIMPAMALNISTMTDEGQQAWLTLRSENLSLENQLNEKKTRLEELESRKPEIVEKIVEVMPEGTEEKILDADKKLKEAKEKNRQADKALKTIKQLQDEKSALELKAAQLNKERNELERVIKTHEAKEQTLTPGAIDDSRAVKLDRLVKELDWIFPDILKENEIAGGYMPRSKEAISEIIRKWSSILIEIGGQSVIDI